MTNIYNSVRILPHFQQMRPPTPPRVRQRDESDVTDRVVKNITIDKKPDTVGSKVLRSLFCFCSSRTK